MLRALIVCFCTAMMGSQAISQHSTAPSNNNDSPANTLIKQPTTIKQPKSIKLPPNRGSATSTLQQKIFQPKTPARLIATQTGMSEDSPTSDDLLAPSRTQVPGEKSPSSGSASPYDEVFLLPVPPTRKKSVDSPEVIQAPSPSLGKEDDELLLQPSSENESLVPSASSPSDKPPQVDRSLVEPQSDDELLNSRVVTPYQKPSVDDLGERVVPLPIKPAPSDFKGFGNSNRELENQLPEPRRTFPLPKVPPSTIKPETPVPDLIPDRFPDSMGKRSSQEAGISTFSRSFDSPEFGALLYPSPTERGQSYGRTVESINEPMLFAATTVNQPRLYDPNPVAENRPTFAPISTLPERLGNRYRQYQFSKELPCSNSPQPALGNCIQEVPYQSADFAPIPQCPQPLNPCQEIETYFGKSLIDTQRPWVEWWRPFYTGGMYDPGIPVFSDANLLTPSFLVYGDYRTGVGIHRANGQEIRNWAHRLNLDMDLRLTGTERFHMFTGPLDHNGRFTRLDFSDTPVEFEEELDFQLDTAFFEGDLGAITGGFRGTDAPFDLPFTCGLVPLLYQNGIWMEDAILGFAVGSPWRNAKALNWANYEATFFAGFNQVTSPAFQNDNSAAAVFGTAWFVEAYNGYIEMDYAYLDDLDNLGRSYHNAAIAYTRRYLGRISNTVRLIGNAGQRGPIADRSADGGLLVVENSLITSQPSTFVPYCNVFLGNGRPQSVARAGNSGGILRNTGINYEGDGLTGYPTLAAPGANSYGGAVGINRLGADFGSQFIVEFAALDTYGDPAISGIAGPQYAIGSRYQRAINNRSLWRVDFINGWLDDAPDIYGTRAEFRWKF
ncbi:MAG: hypothetical protein ACK56W_02480 [Pirellula sp.]